MKERYIFDLDWTLLKTDYEREKNHLRNCIKNDDNGIIDKIGDYLNEYEFLFNNYDVEKLVDYLNYRTNLNFTKGIIEGWIDTMLVNSEVVEEDIFEVLEFLKRKDKSLAVLTNWFGKTQIPRLKNSGLFEYFDEIYTGDICLKPHVNAYMYAIGDYPLDKCVVVGDNLEKDYIWPRAYSIDSILYDRNDDCDENIEKIKRIKELIKK